MTKYIYHLKRPFMEGHTLYSLTALKQLYPQAYEIAIQKYQGREHVLDIYIPHLNKKRYQEVNEFSTKHIDYYKQQIAEGKIPLTFMYHPHILIEGEVNIEGVEVFEWVDGKVLQIE